MSPIAIEIHISFESAVRYAMYAAKSPLLSFGCISTTLNKDFAP